MAEEATVYTCPNCGGPLHFDAALGKLKCDYCDSVFTVEEARKYFDARNKSAEKKKERVKEKEETDAWAEKLCSFVCTSCGAELVADDTTVSMICPYCGNPAVLSGKFGGIRKPDYVIPFRYVKDQAIQKLRDYYSGKHLLPNAFITQNQVQKIQGVYVPFWLFSGSVDADMTFEAGISNMMREGDYEVTRTRHYEVRRAGTVSFEKIPVDASTKMDDKLMDSVEPYDYTAIKPFAYEYLPGFSASRYDVEAKDCRKRADERAANTAAATLRDTVTGYDSVITTGQKTRVHEEKAEYAMMPVWMLHTKWKDDDFVFAMNGQTQKMTGNLPVSYGKAAAWFLGITAAATLLLGLVFMFALSDGSMDTESFLICFVFGAVVGGVSVAAMVRQMRPVAAALGAGRYMDRTNTKLSIRQDIYTHTTETRVRVESHDHGGPGDPGGPGGPGRPDGRGPGPRPSGRPERR